MHTIAIVDDHGLLREALGDFLNSSTQFNVLGMFSSGGDLLEWINKKGFPDVILIDLQMPSMSGIELINATRRISSSVTIIALSAFNHRHMVMSSILAGANGFIYKSSDSKPFLEAITQSLSGKISILEDGINLSAYSDLNELGDSERIKLTERQKLFLKLSAEEKLSYKMIADRLNISPKTADRYRDDLFKKLNVSSRTGLAIYAIKNGLV
jgi:two-component system invasion response regulator UvrY